MVRSGYRFLLRIDMVRRLPFEHIGRAREHAIEHLAPRNAKKWDGAARIASLEAQHEIERIDNLSSGGALFGRLTALEISSNRLACILSTS